MKSYDLVFIATYVDLNTVDGLLKSIDCNDNVKLKIILIAQNGFIVSPTDSAFNSFDVIVVPTQISLSKARNMGLEYVKANNIESKYIMFPDDDTTFDDKFFKNFNQCTSGGNPLVIDVYEQGSARKYIKNNSKAGVMLHKKHYALVGSTNMIIPFNVAENVGLFDEMLGVGAKYGSAEDADYYIRCNDIVEGFYYAPELYNFHPKSSEQYKSMSFRQLKNRYQKYGEGAVFMLYKHRMYSQVFMVCTRALLGAGSFFIRGQFRLSLVYVVAFYYRVKMAIELVFTN